ncbi:MAG: hypothetical protein JO020_28495 [Chloroflexi bacterium]|nr:hypothetical protein [Chloroflexota bacterium]
MKMFRLIVAAVFTVGMLAAATMAHAQANTIPPQPGVLAGQMQVTGPSWTLSSDLPDLSGPWGSVTVTDTNCVTPYRPGTAQAGAVIFTAALTPGVVSDGTLQPFIGSGATGNVTLRPMADTGGTNVTASLNGLEPFVVGTTLSVCLTLGVQPPMLAEINVGQQHVAANNFDVTGVTTAATDADQPLIGISGTQTTVDGTNRQMVFFFLGADFLGTDTSNPSLAALQLIGSPGQDQLDVSYEDPAGGPPVTITYTLASDDTLTASGTPPGH